MQTQHSKQQQPLIGDQLHDMGSIAIATLQLKFVDLLQKNVCDSAAPHQACYTA
jgi:hypothetical protein